MAIFKSNSRGATENFAESYAKTLRPGDVVLLDGDMGAGKTVFSKGVAKGLGNHCHNHRNFYAGTIYAQLSVGRYTIHRF